MPTLTGDYDASTMPVSGDQKIAKKQQSPDFHALLILGISCKIYTPRAGLIPPRPVTSEITDPRFDQGEISRTRASVPLSDRC